MTRQVIGPSEEPPIIILLNVHIIKFTHNDLSLKQSLSVSLSPQQTIFFYQYMNLQRDSQLVNIQRMGDCRGLSPKCDIYSTPPPKVWAKKWQQKDYRARGNDTTSKECLLDKTVQLDT